MMVSTTTLSIPSSAKVISWINLTNGLEALLGHELGDCRVMYLRSSHCEQKRWDLVMASVPDEMLLRLALGQECVVYDYGARKVAPRSVWQGLEFVKYVLNRRWLGVEYQPVGRAASARNYFSWHYHKVVDDPSDQRLKRRLDYFGDYLSAGEVRLSAVTGWTNMDGKKFWFVRVAKNKLLKTEKGEGHA